MSRSLSSGAVAPSAGDAGCGSCEGGCGAGGSVACCGAGAASGSGATSGPIEIGWFTGAASVDDGSGSIETGRLASSAAPWRGAGGCVPAGAEGGMDAWGAPASYIRVCVPPIGGFCAIMGAVGIPGGCCVAAKACSTHARYACASCSLVAGTVLHGSGSTAASGSGSKAGPKYGYRYARPAPTSMRSRGSIFVASLSVVKNQRAPMAIRPAPARIGMLCFTDASIVSYFLRSL